MWNKLMNNWLVSLVLGVLTTLLGFVGMLGEINAVWFSGIFGALIIFAKELLNNQILCNPINYKVLSTGFLGIIITMLVLTWVIL